MNQRLRVIFNILSGICCVILFISILFLTRGYLLLYLVWVALSVGVVAFSARLVKNGMVETIATLIFMCFLFTMILIMGITDAPFGEFWMIARFIIPFLNLPIWWLTGRFIKERIDLHYLRQSRQFAAEIDRILEQRIALKKKMQDRLDIYVADKQQVFNLVRLLATVGEDEGGVLLAEMFEQEEARRATDFMNSLTILARQDRDYKKMNLLERDGVGLLKKVKSDIDKCEWQKVNINLVTAADCTALKKQLKQLSN